MRLCPSRRNLKDDQIKAVAKNHGVICINFYSGFLDSTFHRKVDAIRKRNQALGRFHHEVLSATDYWKTETAHRFRTVTSSIWKSVRRYRSADRSHIDYVARLAGVDHVGIGSDFDGVESLPKGMDDVTCLAEHHLRTAEARVHREVISERSWEGT
jgi:membrane dipeptidase